MSAQAEKVVSDMCAAWSKLDVDQIVNLFTADAIYHNVPFKPAVGRDAIRKTVAALLKDTAWVRFEILHTISTDHIVFNERVDSFETGGRRVSLPVVGVFEITPDGKIKAWRDYFDLESFNKQMR